ALSSRLLTVAVRKYSKETRETNGRVLSFSEESLRGLQTVKTFDLTVRMIGLFRDLTASYREVRLKYEKFNIIMTAVVSFLGMMVSCACYGWAVYRLWQGLITVGTMMLFLQITGSLSSSFSGLASLAPSAVSIATSAGRIMEITGFESEKDADGARAEEVLSGPACGAEIHADNVSFNYSGTGHTVLKDITLDARPGERIAVIGGSGNGKTTLLKLLLGLLRPSSGSLTLSYGGEEFSVSDSTRRFFSYVPQEATLFSGTLEFNLRLAAPGSDDESLRKALKLACMDAFVDSQPDGLVFEVGENGGNLSKGQQQRLLIARALLKDAPVLLLDEATSALDPDTERAVLTNIMKDDPNRTVILTTHKKSVLSYCTRVLRISADGSLAPAER
ncbi:MAG: ABC transporter ATP-binding protein, partial [Clostridia bacterium]|nr:ABC transporter ATP-binding protein [Clostridia bacterium]